MTKKVNLVVRIKREIEAGAHLPVSQTYVCPLGTREPLLRSNIYAFVMPLQADIILPNTVPIGSDEFTFRSYLGRKFSDYPATYLNKLTEAVFDIKKADMNSTGQNPKKLGKFFLFAEQGRYSVRYNEQQYDITDILLGLPINSFFGLCNPNARDNEPKYLIYAIG